MKKQIKTVEKKYYGTLTFYSAYNTSTCSATGTFFEHDIIWFKKHIGRDSVYSCSAMALNLKFYSGIKFDLTEVVEKVAEEVEE